jgi:hypothetical protein
MSPSELGLMIRIDLIFGSREEFATRGVGLAA